MKNVALINSFPNSEKKIATLKKQNGGGAETE